MRQVLIFLFASVIFLIFNLRLSAQEKRARVVLYVIPFYISTPSSIIPSEVKRNASIVIKIFESTSSIDLDSFLVITERISKSDTISMAYDFRVKCVVYNNKRRRLSFYMNKWGDVLMNGKAYKKDETLYDFINAHLPISCKD